MNRIFLFLALMVGLISSSAALAQTPSLTVTAVKSGTSVVVNGTKATGALATISIYVGPPGEPLSLMTSLSNVPDGKWSVVFINGVSAFNGLTAGTYDIEAYINNSTVAYTTITIPPVAGILTISAVPDLLYGNSVINLSGTKTMGGYTDIDIYTAKLGQPIGPQSGARPFILSRVPDGHWSTLIFGLTPGIAYQVEAYVNSLTMATKTITLPATAPSITIGPASATVIAPSTATFSVSAAGVPTPTYQWMQQAPGANGFTVISGATSAAYTTGPTIAANNGTQFECVVSNDAGSVTSYPATLTVKIQPVVAITSPTNNSSSTAGSTITITASASEFGGTIKSVSFYNGQTLLGTSSSSPYSLTWKNVQVGIYDLTATASDAYGVSTTSAPVTMTVNGTIVINMVSPVTGSSMTTGSLVLTAIATEANGSINKVDFYNGSTLLGEVTSSSQVFSYSWTNIPAGTYTLTATATDAANDQSSSSATVTINALAFGYTVDDNIASKTDPRNLTTYYQYDNQNRLVKTTFADNSHVSYTYDLFGNQIHITDQRGNTLTKNYDAYERLASTEDPLGGITQFSYDTNGNLLTLTDANSNAISYSYDADNRVQTETNALNYTTTYSYDPVGNIATRQDANSNTTHYTYDVNNRLTNIAYPDGTAVANVYDDVGNKSSMTDATGETSYSYDNDNRLNKKKDPGGNIITYAYDGENDRTTIVDQNGRTTIYGYDVLNRLATVTAPNALTKYAPNVTTSYGYDADSNKTSVAEPNGVTSSFTYDSLNRVSSASNVKGSTVLSSYTNIYDSAGMIIKKTYQDGSWTAYIYDALNQLLEETRQTSSSIIDDYVYTYDPVGNRLTWTKNTTLGAFWSVDYLNMPSTVLSDLTSAGYGNTAGGTQALSLGRSYSYDKANRLTVWNYGVNINNLSFPVQTDSYTYDNNGNRLSKQVMQTGAVSAEEINYAYDFENRLEGLNYTNISGITGNQTDNLVYNAEGLRVGTNINGSLTNYLYDGRNIQYESNSTGITKSYVRGLDIGGGIGSIITQNYVNGSTAVSQYYNYDDLGSVANTTTTSGTAASSYSYDAYGNLLSPQAPGDTNRYLFSTKEFDTRSGLEYFGARYYDPEIGRWLTQDPLGMVNGPDEYAYCGNNPINCVDPLGLYWGEDQVNWWLYQSVVPGPYGQPVSEWGPNGPTGWGDPIGESDKLGAGCAERIALGFSAGAITVASGGILADYDPLIGWKGGEITFTNPGASTPDFRINPFGDWDNNNPYARLPHYHNRRIDPSTGDTIPGQGIGKHRPWEGGW